MGDRRRRTAVRGSARIARLTRSATTAVAALALAAVSALAGCGGGAKPPTALRVRVDPASSPAYEPVHVTISGGDPGSTVTLTASAVDDKGVRWTSHADFRADAHGAVDLAAQAPVGGTYSGVDAMGLFWSMDPPSGEGLQGFPTKGFTATLTATDQGATTSQTVTRVFQAPGETVRELTVAHDGFQGHLFLPPGLTKPTPALIMIGGSEGGESTYTSAMLMASKGFPALSLGYFKVPGTPQNLENIPLEYFAAAAAWLEQQPMIAKRHVVVFGVSRGSEAALLTAQNYPDLVHGVVLISPSAEVWGSLPGPDGDAWTLKGKPVAPVGTDIAVDQVDGPLAAFAGIDDKLWNSMSWARQIDQELNLAGDPYPHAEHEYEGAGHMVGSVPYLPLLTTYDLDGRTLQLGGTRQANASAQAQTWKGVFDLLAGLAD